MALVLKARGPCEFVFFFLIAAAFVVAAVLPEIAWATPQIIRVDGSVFDAAGAPVTASKDIQIKAYDSASGGTLLWTSDVYNTAVTSGKFTINLDAAAGSPSLVDRLGERTTSQAIYFQIEVDSGAANGSMDTPTVVLPRMRARGTAFALTAGSADGLKGVTTSVAEMNYLGGVSANVQSQLNAVNGTAAGVSGKVSKTGDTMSGALDVGANITSTGTVTAGTLKSTGVTASRFAMFDASKNLASSATSVTDTEFGYLGGVTANLATNLNGLTANVQTQLNGKQATLAYVPVSKLGDSMSGALQVGASIMSTSTITAATINGTGLTANRALVTDASKNLVSAAVTDVEIGYLSGVTSSLAAKINKFSATEAGYLAGVTANIQTQINSNTGAGKVALAGDTLSGGLRVPWIQLAAGTAPSSPPVGAMFYSSNREQMLVYSGGWVGTDWYILGSHPWHLMPPTSLYVYMLHAIPFEYSAADFGGLAASTTTTGTLSYTAGKFGQAVSSTSTSNYVTTAATLLSSYTASGFSISAWVKGTDTGASGDDYYPENVVYGTASDPAAFLGFGVETGNAALLPYTGTAIKSTASVSNGSWHHIASVFTYSGGTWSVQLYVDGTADGSGTLPSAWNASYSFDTLGMSSATKGCAYSIDGFMSFSTALSLAQVQALSASSP